MGLFSKIKKVIGKTIVLDSDKKDSLITRQQLKNGELKLDSELDVDEGFDVVLCQMDKVCDCLGAGKYRFNDINTPRLYKCVKPKKTAKGYVTPKAIPADVYYVNKTLLSGLTFRTHRKFRAIYESKKVKINIEGTFEAKVVDSRKFVETLLNDYATLENEKVKLELADYVSYSVLNIVEKDVFNVEELKNNSEGILNALNQGVQKELLKIGVEISNIKITGVLAPRFVASKKQLEEKKDDRLENIFNEAYGDPISNAKEKCIENELKQKVLVGDGGNKENVINLGYGGQGASVAINTNKTTFNAYTSGNESSQDDTDAEYKKMTQSLARLDKKDNDLVFIGGADGIVPTPREPEERKHVFSPGVVPDFSTKTANVKPNEGQESDIMLGRTAIHNVGEFEKAEIADDFIQRQRKIEINRIKESIQDNIDKPKVIKASKNVCKYCSNKLNANDLFCPKCGKSTKGIKYCKSCGEENEDNATVCKMCGSKF